MAYFVGLDSGGTKTECWLGDEERVLGRAAGGTVKLTRVPLEEATGRMRWLLTEVSAAAGVGLEEVSRTCVGIAGYSIAEVREWAERVVGEMVGGEVEVCGDEEIGLDAAFRGGPGILVIGGTGANVVGRCGDGMKLTVGGWGPAIGDEGSGFWIGREAVRAGFRALDRGEKTDLLEWVRMAWGAKDLGGLVAQANTRPGPDFSGLVPVVVELAGMGDVVADRVLVTAGRLLAEQVEALWGKMRRRGETEARVAYTGSVVEKIESVREEMKWRIGVACEGLRVVEGAVNSMEGAMWRARRGV